MDFLYFVVFCEPPPIFHPRPLLVIMNSHRSEVCHILRPGRSVPSGHQEPGQSRSLVVHPATEASTLKTRSHQEENTLNTKQTIKTTHNTSKTNHKRNKQNKIFPTPHPHSPHLHQLPSPLPAPQPGFSQLRHIEISRLTALRVIGEVQMPHRVRSDKVRSRECLKRSREFQRGVSEREDTKFT